MSINEMIRNVNALAIPGLNVPLAITVDEITETVRKVMFERFVSTVAAYSEVCGISVIDDPKEFAVDFMQNDDYSKMCLTATVNLVLNGGFSNKSALDGFLNRLLWSHVAEACREELSNLVIEYPDDDELCGDDDVFPYAVDDVYPDD